MTGKKTIKMETEDAAVKYTKEQLAVSGRYVHQCDLVRVLLAEGKTYALNEVDALIQDFKERKVR